MLFNNRRRCKIPRVVSSSATALCLVFVLGISSAHGDGLVAQSPTSSSVTLFWTAPGDDGTSGTASEYDVRYSTSPITEANWGLANQADGEPTPQIAGSSESFVITGLDPNTTYYFAIKAADEVPNWSELSNVVSVTTPDTQAPAAIADLSNSAP